MTYHARGRSVTEVVVAAIFVGFLTGFVFVLCIGNYYRAKLAMQRQRERRLQAMRHGNAAGMADSPKSNPSSTSTTGSNEQTSLLPRQRRMHRDHDLLLEETTASSESRPRVMQV